MTRLHPDDIQAIAERVAALLGGVVTPQPTQRPGDDLLTVLRTQGIQAAQSFAKAQSKGRRNASR